MDKKTVREFSPAGPCLARGELIRETPRFYVFRDRWGVEGRGAKHKMHIEPCRACRDHPQTQYPNGYMD